MKTCSRPITKYSGTGKASLIRLVLLVMVFMVTVGLQLPSAQAQVSPPIGTITAYAGPVNAAWEDQSGWMLCDGRSVDRTLPKYRALFDAIGSSWGGDGVNRFNVPDLRGLFLRGVDGQADRDPDKNARAAINPGGHSGNDVGSLQNDEFESHLHAASGIVQGRPFSSTPINKSEWPSGFAGGGAFHDGGASGVSRSELGVAVKVEKNGGQESRPVNATVNWIIRYR